MQRFRNILFVAMPDSSSDAAFEHAAALAENNQARLTVIEVLEAIPFNLKLLSRSLSIEELQASMVAEHQKGLEERVASWKSNTLEVQTKVLIGIPFLSIIREVLLNGHDLVVKAAEVGGLFDRVLGSEDMHLLRKCPCPVWLVKPKSPKAYRRILAAVDVDDFYPPRELSARRAHNCQILEIAISLALSEFAELHIVVVWNASLANIMAGTADTPEEEIVAYLEEIRHKYTQDLNTLLEGISVAGQEALEYLNSQTHLLPGLPRVEVPVLAEKIKADIVVMGTVCRTGISGFFIGNSAETILGRLNCTLFAIKPSGFVTPVTLEDQNNTTIYGVE